MKQNVQNSIVNHMQALAPRYDLQRWILHANAWDTDGLAVWSTPRLTKVIQHHCFPTLWKGIWTKTAPTRKRNSICYWWGPLSFREAVEKGRCGQTDLLKMAIGVPGDPGWECFPKPAQGMHANQYEVHSLAFPGAQHTNKDKWTRIHLFHLLKKKGTT